MNRDVIERATTNETTYFGRKTSRYGVEEPLGVADSDRMMHTAVTGPTGQGKSNLLGWIALQDSHKTGCTFLNPKGGVIDRLLAKLPDERLDDVIYVNPNRNHVPGINLLNPEVTAGMTEAERTHQQKIVVSSVMGLFRRLTDDWGERWPRNLRSLVAAHVALNIHRNETNTVMDLYRCVTDRGKLQQLIDRTPDTVIQEQLEEVTRLNRRELDPLRRRLADLVENETVREIIAQRESDVSFREVLQEQSIVLVDAQSGQVGDWAASIIGSVVLTQLWSATAARSALSPEDRPPYHIIVDEIQEFVAEADHIRRMLSQCREFNVSITAATQYLDDLDPTMQRALLNNTLTKIVFTPGASEDVTTFTTIMNGLTRDDLSRLGKYQPAVQLPAEKTLPPARVIKTYPPWSIDHESVAARKETLLTQYSSEDRTEGHLGDGANAGGEKHLKLLTIAKERLEDRGFQVELLYQEAGDDKPDGFVHLPTDDIAHLEAEHATLSRPIKVLRNYLRGIRQNRTVFFVVETGNASKLERIITDPVNRVGDRHQDETGTYDYYVDEDGDRFTDVEKLASGDYRILEVDGDDLTVRDPVESTEASDALEHLREKDREVFRCIADGADDVQKLTAATGYTNYEIDHCFEKLEDEGLIEVGDPEPVERVINGQNRVFEVRTAWLTDRGKQHLEPTD